MIGKENKNMIYLCDFGLSKFYRKDNLQHLEEKKDKRFVGTIRYSSINAHKGYGKFLMKNRVEEMIWKVWDIC